MLKVDTGGQVILRERVDGLRRQVVRAKEDLSQLFAEDHPNYVRWGAHVPGHARRNPNTTLNLTPISLAPLLESALWKEPRAVGSALVSATLSTSGNFAFVRHRLGIPGDIDGTESRGGVSETIVGSPFDYGEHCLLYIPDHLPQPSDDPMYMHQLVDEIVALLLASRGGAFLLFTSYRALNYVHEQLGHLDLRLPILRQGQMPNMRLVEAFKEQANAVLLGTQSFWEGVDVPGDGLRMVVIDKVPFAVPDSPVYKARADTISKSGGDWFRDYALPQAQLRLKQGFGRLIRTETDRGVVAVLDTRLLHKTYGPEFLRFLPPARRAFHRSEVSAFFADIQK